jgi:hypothetical protein
MVVHANGQNNHHQMTGPPRSVGQIVLPSIPFQIVWTGKLQEKLVE